MNITFCIFLIIIFLTIPFIIFFVNNKKSVENSVEKFALKTDDEMLSQPDYSIKELPNFLSDKECDTLIKIAENKGLTESKLYSDDTSSDSYDTSVRKSEQTWLYDNDDLIIKNLSNRIAKLVKLPLENQEALQVVHYGIGGKYEPHYDACISKEKETCARMNKDAGARYLTVLVYLNTVPEGGGTYFPYLKRTVKAEKGKVVIFQNTEDNTQEIIKEAKHGGNPVLSGEKWIANKWIHFNALSHP